MDRRRSTGVVRRPAAGAPQKEKRQLIRYYATNHQRTHPVHPHQLRAQTQFLEDLAGRSVRSGVRRLRHRDLPVRHSAIEDTVGRLPAKHDGSAKYGRYHHARIGRLLRLLHRRAAGLVRTTGTVVGETPEVVPQPTRLPRAVLPADRIGVQFPGTSFSAISYAFAAAVVVLFPLLCHLSGSCCRKRRCGWRRTFW